METTKFSHMVEWGNRARRAAKEQQEAKQDGIATERQCNLSKEQAKQDQTTTTASEPSEPLPQVPPPPCGNALVTYKKLKQEKSNEGKENDFKRTWKCDICVGKERNNCD